MAQMKDDMIPFITAAEIDELTTQLAQQIERDYEGKEIILICPLKGSCLFLSDLSRKIQLPQQIEFVQLTSPKGESVRILKDISMNIGNKHLLIVEEIIDAGRTLSFLQQRLIAAGPASVKIVTLLDKPARRELPIKPDYCGKTIDDRYVVGYGLDSEEIGRNYKDIFYFTQ